MIVILWSLVVLSGGFALACRVLPEGAPKSLKAAAAWPLGSLATAWLMLAALLLGLKPTPLLAWVASIAPLVLIRPNDLRGWKVPAVVLAGLAVAAAFAMPLALARCADPWGEGDALALWQRRALSIANTGSLWSNPEAHPLGGYPHAMSLLHLAGKLIDGDAGLGVAKLLPWWSLVSMLFCMGALWEQGAKRIPSAIAVGTLVLTPPLLHHLSTGYADVPFAACVMLVVTMLLTVRSSWRSAFLLGVFAGGAAFTKREGEALMVAVLAAVAAEPALDPIGGTTLRLRRLTTPLFALVGAAMLMAPEIVVRIAHGAHWPAGVGAPSFARLPQTLTSFAADPLLVALAIPVAGVAAILPVVLLAPRELTRLATGPLRAACVVVLLLAVADLVAILGSPMWVTVQVQTAADRLLIHVLAPSLAILVTALGPRPGEDPMARWSPSS